MLTPHLLQLAGTATVSQVHRWSDDTQGRVSDFELRSSSMNRPPKRLKPPMAGHGTHGPPSQLDSFPRSDFAIDSQLLAGGDSQLGPLNSQLDSQLLAGQGLGMANFDRCYKLL